MPENSALARYSPLLLIAWLALGAGGCSQQILITVDGDLGADGVLYARLAADTDANNDLRLVKFKPAVRAATLTLPSALRGAARVEVYAVNSAGCAVSAASVPVATEPLPKEIKLQLQPPASPKRCLLSPMVVGDGVPGLTFTSAVPGPAPVPAEGSTASEVDWLVPVGVLLSIAPQKAIPADRFLLCETNSTAEVYSLGNDVANEPQPGCQLRLPLSTAQKINLTLRLDVAARRPELTVQLAGRWGASRVYSAPETPGIDCGSRCAAQFPGHQVVLQVQADENSYFVGWSEPSCGESATCKFTMSDRPVVITATFAPRICSGAGLCWENPLPQGNDLQAVHGTAKNAVWAVGKLGTILHFDGTVWTAESSGVNADLYGVFALEKGGKIEVWAVGNAGTVLFRDTTGVWHSSLGAHDDLKAVWGAPTGGVWAVGGGGTLCSLQVGIPLSCSRQAGNQNLSSIWFSDGQSRWMLTTRGEVWSQTADKAAVKLTVPAPATYPVIAGIQGHATGTGFSLRIVFSNGQIYDSCQPAGWCEVATDKLPISYAAVSAWSSDDRSATYVLVHTGGLQSYKIFRFDEDHWSEMFLGADVVGLPQTNAMWMTADAGWVVGDSGSMLQFATAWHVWAGSRFDTLADIHGRGRDSLLAVSSGAVVLRRESASGRWGIFSTAMGVGDAIHLSACWEQSPGQYWVAGSPGMLRFFDGSDWKTMLGPAAGIDWRAVHGDSQDLWLLGGEGSLWHGRGDSKWLPEGSLCASPNSCIRANALSGDEQNLFVVVLADEKKVWRFNKSSKTLQVCNPASTPKSLMLNGIWAIPDSQGSFITVGYQPLPPKQGVLYYGVGCDLLNKVEIPQLDKELRGVSGANGRYVAVGEGGFVLSEALGQDNLPQMPRVLSAPDAHDQVTQSTLNKAIVLGVTIDNKSETQAFIAGENGTLLRYRFP